MRHVIDEILDNNGALAARIVVHTERAAWNMVAHPDGKSAPIDLVDAIEWHRVNNPDMKGTGYEIPSSHPDHKGRTRMEAYLAEIVKNNDVEAMKVHSINP